MLKGLMTMRVTQDKSCLAVCSSSKYMHSIRLVDSTLSI